MSIEQQISSANSMHPLQLVLLPNATDGMKPALNAVPF